MSVFQVMAPIVSAAAFLAWASLLFAAIFKVRRIASARTGGSYPGVAATLGGWRVFLGDPANRRHRNALLVLTVALILNAVLSAVLAARGAA